MLGRNLAYQFIIQLPFSGSIAPIILPSFYLWFVDTVALRKGTWVIESGTKFGVQLWNGLELEYIHIHAPKTVTNFWLTTRQRSSILSPHKCVGCIWPYRI